MGNAVDARGAAGIGLGDATRPEVRSSLAHLARRVREEGVRTLGLAPADDDVNSVYQYLIGGGEGGTV